ncbi:hypothetical protein AcW1_007415 [Taiwanofungus camphoratus]|nr:hypothetical protein AcW2_007524 [Antrodia cinnamomea]KAI0927297.1 hypothetical protein AcV5_007861 [Antrodia cinnamomea]KAI0947094.1 hypothetical protein AcV7_009616 [Antrodia cinnamomea]KAI0953099.1 hypothetical protein AcW1_007415 [Antrodia cinnamomea]KAI0953100.1 hypothetical protein AcW1_007415 [Antrodia cinnamomea]
MMAQRTHLLLGYVSTRYPSNVRQSQSQRDLEFKHGLRCGLKLEAEITFLKTPTTCRYVPPLLPKAPRSSALQFVRKGSPNQRAYVLLITVSYFCFAQTCIFTLPTCLFFQYLINVINNGTPAYADAYFEILYIKVFSASGAINTSASSVSHSPASTASSISHSTSV